MGADSSDGSCVLPRSSFDRFLPMPFAIAKPYCVPCSLAPSLPICSLASSAISVTVHFPKVQSNMAMQRWPTHRDEKKNPCADSGTVE